MVRATIDDFKVALQFLTRLPVRVPEPWPEGALARSVPMFPLIGLLIGVAGALAFTIASWLGLPPALAAVLAVAVQVLSTGGLHEDGLADLADGFGGGRTREEKLEIMRDSHLGSFGAIALILALLARTGAIVALAQPAHGRRGPARGRDDLAGHDGARDAVACAGAKRRSRGDERSTAACPRPRRPGRRDPDCLRAAGACFAPS